MGLFDKKTTKKEPKKAAPKTVEATKDMYSAEAKAETKTAKSASQKGTAISQAYRILLRPIVSEKASRQQSSANQYSFAVALDANKIEVARAVKSVYGINPTSVNIVRVEGKRRNFGRFRGKRKDWKKAIVTLPSGKTIALHEGV